MKKVLLTGAGGFIGRHCLPLLLAKGYEVHAVSRNIAARSHHPGVVWHAVDLLRPGSPSELVDRLRPDCTLHMAWYAAPGKFWIARENIDWVRASLELLSACADSGTRRFVAAGTCAEYISNPGECIESQTRLHPTTLYGVCKHALETILRSSSEQTGLSSAWGRIFFLYGPHEDPSRVVAYALNAVLRNEPALCSDGTQILDFLHVEDVASAFVALLDSDVQGPVNIGSGRPVALRDVLLEIGRQMERQELIHLGARPSSGPNEKMWANSERLTKEVGWSPHYDLATGIAQTLDWWRALRERRESF